MAECSSVHIRTVNPYRVMKEAYDGTGGFSPMFAFGDSIGISNNVDGGAYSYIIRKKSEKTYSERVVRSIYYNRYAGLINSKVDPVFTKQIPYTSVAVGGTPIDNHRYSVWCDDVTGSGVSKNDLMRNCARAATRDGVAFLVMDVSENGDIIEYFQEAITVDKTTLQVGRSGKISQISFIGASRDDARKTERVTWTASVVTFEESGGVDGGWMITRQVANPIGVIPVYPMFADSRSDCWNYLPFPSQSYGVMMACYGLFETWSGMTNLEDKQGHSRLVLSGADAKSIPADGTTNALALENPVGGANPEAYYISPEAAHHASYIETINLQVAQLKQLASESGVDAVEASGQAESGVAKAFTFTARNEALMRTRGIVVQADKWTQETYKRYNGAGAWIAETSYASDYTPKIDLTVQEQMDLADFYKMNHLTITYKETVKQIAQKQFDGNSDTLNMILGEIDEVSVQQDDLGIQEKTLPQTNK